MKDIDYAPATEFLAQFFGPTTTEAVEIRALPNESGASPARPLFTRNPSLVLAHCTRWDDIDRAVYFGVATRIGGIARGDRTNLAELPALWTDIDTYKIGISRDEAVAALLSLSIPPGVIVDSGGGVHAYWLLSEAIDVSQADASRWPATELAVVSVLKQLAGIFAGDLAVCDLARILRLPGTHNTKTGALRPCSVLPCSTWARCEFGDLVDMLDTQRPLIVAPLSNGHAEGFVTNEDPFIAASKLLTFKPSVDIEGRLSAMTYLGTGDAGIHATQLSVSASLVAQGVEPDAIASLLLSATQSAAGPLALNWNWSREEASIRGMIASAVPKFAPSDRGASRSPPSSNVIELRSGGPRPVEEPEGDPISPAGGFVRNDIGNAFALIDIHGTELRYVLGVGWHAWDGRRYAVDPEDVIAQRMAHDVSARMLASAADMPASKARSECAKWAVTSGNRSRITGMLEAAKSYIHASSDALDADPMLLNCANGTLDLRSLTLRPHAQADLLTKLCPVPFEPAALCPIWDRFISEIFDGDEALVAFVQRAIGYSLTARTDEQVVFIMHGAGSNGKSVLLETIAAVLCDYVKRSPAETWISKPYNGPSNDVAALAGARFVSVIETEHDKSLAEALVKQATGGDAMTARFLHKEFFSFVPKFKLWFATNHKPKIRGSDYAIWRRILLLPFLVTFVDADKLTDGQKVKDPDLKMKLADELPGILAWMIRGCSEWQRIGLAAPEAVVNATESYQDAQDNVSGFIRDYCHLSRGLTCAVGLLYDGYEIWCRDNEETASGKIVFGRSLDERGYVTGPRSDKARLRKGLDMTEFSKGYVLAELAKADADKASANDKSDKSDKI